MQAVPHVTFHASNFPTKMASVCWSGRVTQLAPLPSLHSWPSRARAQLRQPAAGAWHRHITVAVSSTDAPTSESSPPVKASNAPQPIDAEEFECMLDKLRAWKETYYDCIVPRKVHDAADLGEWVHRMRQLHRRGRLPPEAAQQLQGLGFAWEVDVITAKWYHNLHAARQYKELHGSGDIPTDYSDAAQPDWVEAARWLERQRELYRRQKLLLVRVRLLKEVLGIKLQREYSKPRRNMHQVLKEGNKKFKSELRQRQQSQRQHRQTSEARSLEQAVQHKQPEQHPQ